MIENMTRAQIDKVTNHNAADKPVYIRPSDAATLILIDGEPGNYSIVMGRRHMRHKFMPGLFVFPGGRVDKTDGSVPTQDALHPEVEKKILSRMKGRPTTRRARALALAAIRETYEEAGLFVGGKSEFKSKYEEWAAFTENKVAPQLQNLRLVARAITPPGRPRRFDTWFFAAFTSEISARLPEGTGPSGELEDLHWLSFDAARALELPAITKTIIGELESRLQRDPELTPSENVPFYHLRGNAFQREMI